MATFDLLPDHLFGNILEKYLTVFEIAVLDNAISNKTLRKSLYLAYNNITEFMEKECILNRKVKSKEEILWVSKRFLYLRSIKIPYNDDSIYNTICTLFRVGKYLQKIDIADKTLWTSPITENLIFRIGENCHNLRSLSLCYFQSITAPIMNNLIGEIPGLTSLSLYSCDIINLGTLNVLAKGKFLGCISINLCNFLDIIDERDLMLSLQAIATGCSSLTMLSLRGIKFPVDMRIESILTTNGFPVLKQLVISKQSRGKDTFSSTLKRELFHQNVDLVITPELYGSVRRIANKAEISIYRHTKQVLY